MNSPRILFFTSHLPGAKAYGSQMRAYHTARMLSEFGDLEMALVPLAEPSPEEIRKSRELMPIRGIYSMAQWKRSKGERLRYEFDPFFVNTHGLRIESKGQEELMAALPEYDLLWFHSMRMGNILGLRELPNSVLDIDDIPSQYHQSALSNAKSIREKIGLKRKISQWKRREAALLKRFSTVIVCSEKDHSTMGGSEEIKVIPNGFTLEETEKNSKPTTEEMRIGFIGTHAYEPNNQGVDWFLDSVWPLLRKQFPDLRLRLAGAQSEKRNSPEDGVDGLGFVDDPATEIASWNLMIVPIHIGGGTRIKIAESFARMCPVVSTQLGAFGYNVKSGEELMLADSAQDFADACDQVISNPELAKRLTEKAHSLYQKGLSWEAQRPQLQAAISQLG